MPVKKGGMFSQILRTKPTNTLRRLEDIQINAYAFTLTSPSSPPNPRHNLFSGILRKQKVGGLAKRLLFSSIIRKL